MTHTFIYIHDNKKFKLFTGPTSITVRLNQKQTALLLVSDEIRLRKEAAKTQNQFRFRQGRRAFHIMVG